MMVPGLSGANLISYLLRLGELMFEKLFSAPPDEILELMQAFRNDPRPNKIDLGVGVYKDHNGYTPIMKAIKIAEKKLWASESTKSYVGLTGDVEFHQVMIDLILGDTIIPQRIAAAATPGGTGALRQGLELIKIANPRATIWLSDPTWPNHPSIAEHLELKVAKYRYFNKLSQSVSFDEMLIDLSNAKEGDVVLLHGCCHNPTGANLNHSQWVALAELLCEKRLVPLIDIAYQGFGDGLEEDTKGLRHLSENLPEVIIASSCSKNFGIYRERTGIILLISDKKCQKKINQDMLAFLNRNSFSFPPDHGSRLVTIVLQDNTLRKNWEEELRKIRSGMIKNRDALARELRSRTGSDHFGFLSEHRGMFSLLGFSEEKVSELRSKHGIYMVSDSRVNIAALSKTTIPIVAEAIISVGL